MRYFFSIFSDTPFLSGSQAEEEDIPPGDAEPVYGGKDEKNHRLWQPQIKENVVYMSPVRREW
jgi:hypothetical protein